MLRIPSPVLAAVQAHARQAYPHECCGFLVGVPGDPRVCRRAVPATNVRTDRPHDRYEIDPLEWLRLEKSLTDGAEAVLGIYHSHPDHPDRPSQFDREHAHPNLSYVIVETTAAGTPSTRCWRLDGKSGTFQEEALSIDAEG